MNNQENSCTGKKWSKNNKLDLVNKDTWLKFIVSHFIFSEKQLDVSIRFWEIKLINQTV